MILEDLKRQYYFEGQAHKTATWWRCILKTFSPRFLPIVIYRCANFLATHRLGFLARIFSLVNFLLFGIEIACQCKIGPGLYFPHTMGTVIGANSIGKNALIYHGVTIGAKEMDIAYSNTKRPSIGDNVTIGSGAKILGGIMIGNNVIIGANAVVTESVPDNVLVTGIPARIKKHLNSSTETEPTYE